MVVLGEGRFPMGEVPHVQTYSVPATDRQTCFDTDMHCIHSVTACSRPIYVRVVRGARGFF